MKRLALALTCGLFAACNPGKVCADASASGTLCIPDGGALADAKLSFAVHESCGSPCDDFDPVCRVVRSGSEISVNLVGTSCTDPDVKACPAICSIRTFRCDLGPLPAGTYVVRSGAEEARTLVITDAGATRCGLDGG